MNQRKEKILLTGSEGMLGRYLRREFLDYDITPLNRRETDGGKSCDLSHNIPELTERYDLVIHAAGTTDAGLALDVNLEGTKNLIRGLAPLPPARLIYISDAAVYGLTGAEDIDETSNTWTSEKVGQSKILAEKELEKWCAANDVELTILRPAWMFGAGISGDTARLFDEVRTSRYIHIRGNNARRGIVTAYDVARVAFALRETSGIFNVADGFNRPFIDLVHAMSSNTGAHHRMTHLPAKWAAIAARLPGLRRLLDSDTLARRATTITYNPQKVIAATGLALFDTVEVIARRDKNFPYEDL